MHLRRREAAAAERGEHRLPGPQQPRVPAMAGLPASPALLGQMGHDGQHRGVHRAGRIPAVRGEAARHPTGMALVFFPSHNSGHAAVGARCISDICRPVVGLCSRSVDLRRRRELNWNCYTLERYIKEARACEPPAVSSWNCPPHQATSHRRASSSPSLERHAFCSFLIPAVCQHRVVRQVHLHPLAHRARRHVRGLVLQHALQPAAGGWLQPLGGAPRAGGGGIR